MLYSQEFKDACLRRMLPPNNESITKIAKEEDYLLKLSLIGELRQGSPAMSLPVQMQFPMTEAHRINF